MRLNRICSVVGACIVQLIYTARARGTGDLTFDLWPMVVCTQIVQCVSLTTACIPYLQPFLMSLESGLLRGDDFRQHSKKDSSYLSERRSKSGPTSNTLSDNGSGNRSGPVASETSNQSAKEGPSYPQDINMLPMPAAGEPLYDRLGISWDSRSGSSHAGLTGLAVSAPAAVDTRRRELEGY